MLLEQSALWPGGGRKKKARVGKKTEGNLKVDSKKLGDLSYLQLGI